MTHVSIVGTGTMGSAISGLVRRGGNTVDAFNTSDIAKPLTGEIVVLAVRHPAVAEVIAQRRDQLRGKVVVDITNPLNLETYDTLSVPPDSSATAEIAAALPESRVIKAFNTNLVRTLTAGTIGSEPTTVLMAGDDAEAKELLARVVTAGGLRTLDIGGLARARELEALAFLQISLATEKKLPWTGGFAVVT
jgi:8-hydroxy-5-deazaflavin:NADPH oxidoreductase